LFYHSRYQFLVDNQEKNKDVLYLSILREHDIVLINDRVSAIGVGSRDCHAPRWIACVGFDVRIIAVRVFDAR
jgi:hypothetical protein